jgi:hypothetical protein
VRPDQQLKSPPLEQNACPSRWETPTSLGAKNSHRLQDLQDSPEKMRRDETELCPLLEGQISV